MKASASSGLSIPPAANLSTWVHSMVVGPSLWSSILLPCECRCPNEASGSQSCGSAYERRGASQAQSQPVLFSKYVPAALQKNHLQTLSHGTGHLVFDPLASRTRFNSLCGTAAPPSGFANVCKQLAAVSASTRSTEAIQPHQYPRAVYPVRPRFKLSCMFLYLTLDCKPKIDRKPSLCSLFILGV